MGGRLLLCQFVISALILSVQMARRIRCALADPKRRRRILKELSPRTLIRRSNVHLLLTADGIDDDDDDAESLSANLNVDPKGRSKVESESGSTSSSNTKSAADTESDSKSSDSSS